MRIRVRLFASHREALGKSEETLELPERSTAGEAFARLCAMHAALKPFEDTVAFAVNREQAPAGEQLQEGDELAVLPPVAGG